MHDSLSAADDRLTSRSDHDLLTIAVLMSREELADGLPARIEFLGVDVRDAARAAAAAAAA